MYVFIAFSFFLALAGCLIKQPILRVLESNVWICFAVIRAEKTRKEYSVLLKQYRAAVAIQKQFKGRIGREKFKHIQDASVLLQSGTNRVAVFADSLHLKQ